MWIIWIIMIIVATFIGAGKNRPVLGFVLGFLLGLIGVIIIACLSPKENVKSQVASDFYYNPSNPSHNPPKQTGTIFKD